MASKNRVTDIRRTPRQSKPSLKAMESLYISKLEQSGFVAAPSSDEDNLSLDVDSEIAEKPKLLHDNDLVHGDKIFTFQSRKTKEGMAQKAAEVEKTPHTIRNKIKSRISSEAFVASDSDFVCSTSESETTEDETEVLDKSSGSGSASSSPEISKQTKVRCNKDNLRSVCKMTNKKYMIKTDEYFSNYKSSKTSNNTLDKLETPRLPQYQLQQLLSEVNLSETHQKCVHNLYETNKTNFQKWLFLLNENFNILVYGLGSKRNILNDFHNECLTDMPVVVVNGFFPSLTLKNILDGIITELLELNECSANLNESCDIILKEFEAMPEIHLYLIIHNIDSDMLRNSKTQSAIARLASTKNIHLIASIDHIHAPLIWDHRNLSKFNYIWWDVTLFLPYFEETSFEKSMMVKQSGTLALSSLRNVFLSLTTNSKSIYLKIVEYQLQNTGQFYQGMAFKDLYLACRESFIVSTDLALRAQLNEFVDHKMIKTKRSSEDGSERLVIPIANALLQKFLDENGS